MTTDQVTRKEGIGVAMGRIPTGVFVITAHSGSQKVGMLASWITQAGFEPPSISVAVHPDRELYKLVQETGRFSVNVLSNENMSLMKAFSRYSPDQFDQVAHEQTENGVTLKDAVAVMECRVMQTVDAADHLVLIAEVLNGEHMNLEREPMVHFRKSGFSY